MSAYDCFCDFDAPSMFNARIVTARKQHKCGECARLIDTGDRYEYVCGIWSGRFETYKTCARCIAVREYVTAHVPCFCWCYTTMLLDADDHMREVAWQVPGMWMEYGRLRVAVRKQPRMEAGR